MLANPAGWSTYGGTVNRPDDPEYILRLLAWVITVSLETVKLLKALPLLRCQR